MRFSLYSMYSISPTSFRKRSNKPEDKESHLQLIIRLVVKHVRIAAKSTIARSSIIRKTRLSNVTKFLTQKEKKIYTGVVFHHPLPEVTPPYTTHPHVTGYSKDLVISGPHTVCRCNLPTAHGDAFTRRHHAEAANKITFLSAVTPTTPSRPLNWEEAAHTLLDAVQVESRVSPGWQHEDEALLRKVFAESTVREIKTYAEVWHGTKRVQGDMLCLLEDDVFWWGEKNPKGIQLRDLSRVSAGQTLSVNGPFYGQPV